jgi:hypothetical protein
MTYRQIPYATEQGTNCAVAGNQIGSSGKLLARSGNPSAARAARGLHCRGLGALSGEPTHFAGLRHGGGAFVPPSINGEYRRTARPRWGDSHPRVIGGGGPRPSLRRRPAHRHPSGCSCGGGWTSGTCAPLPLSLRASVSAHLPARMHAVRAAPAVTHSYGPYSSPLARDHSGQTLQIPSTSSEIGDLVRRQTGASCRRYQCCAGRVWKRGAPRNAFSPAVA